MKEFEKKRLWIFIAVAYGVTALMSIFMFIGYRKEYDLTTLVNTHMMYPACGVILGKLIVKKDDEKLPVGGYITILITTGIMILFSICSVLFETNLNLPVLNLSIWDLGSQIVLLIGSIVAYILFWTCGKEKRQNAGLLHVNMGKSAVMIVLFVFLYFSRLLLSVLVSGISSEESTITMGMMKTAITNPRTLILLIVLIPNFILVFIAFFGEEYGWRYYFQPLLQERFGLRNGVIILGLLWGLWHFDVDMMYYTKTTGPQMFVSQLITCITVGIFFGYAYMKTQNIWVPVIMHYLNNNLLAVLAGGDTSILQNQVINWKDIPLFFVIALVYAVFIFAPIYSE